MKIIDMKKCVDSVLPVIYDEQICVYYRLGTGACKEILYIELIR
jgi:hypothetical protein